MATSTIPAEEHTVTRGRQRRQRRTQSSRQGLTAVRVDVVGLQEADFEVVQDGGLVQVTESGEVILPHQDVGVTQER